MDDMSEQEPHITLPISGDRSLFWGADFVSVPADVLLNIVDVQRCYLALWKPPPSLEPREQAITVLAARSAGVLSDLLDAYAAHNRQGGARALVEQLDEFLQWPDIRTYLEELRDQRESGDI